ncbi:hypothetical protein A2U01_0093306 [Trifolium medium]|uniref:Uncharacterized protein n=1 Tax=Trifolium medium TaxID=97028 RepID=A0A392UEU8_9FABA|nr:hypothetical protein [Trifolium medium]
MWRRQNYHGTGLVIEFRKKMTVEANQHRRVTRFRSISLLQSVRHRRQNFVTVAVDSDIEVTA